MDYEIVIAFQRIEAKLDDIGLMTAELINEKRKKKKTKTEKEENTTEKIKEEFEQEPQYQ